MKKQKYTLEDNKVNSRSIEKIKESNIAFIEKKISLLDKKDAYYEQKLLDLNLALKDIKKI